jgi:truncated hemoglobin YjbI
MVNGTSEIDKIIEKFYLKIKNIPSCGQAK